MKFFTYIIYSLKLDRYYIGHTSDLSKRLNEHNQGISGYTSRASDWKFVYNEEFDTREGARGRELQIKSKKSRKYLEYLIKENS